MNETVKGLIIYDNTGRVWGIFSGEDQVPEGVQGFITDLPASGVKEIQLDMSTTPPTPHIIPYPDTNVEISDLQLAMIEMDARVSALEGGN